MKFQDSSFNGLKVTVGTKSVTHPPTHAPKAICPINFFKVGGITISCHSNKSSYPTGIKNTTFVEANVLSMYAKFQLHPPYGFGEEDF